MFDFHTNSLRWLVLAQTCGPIARLCWNMPFSKNRISTVAYVGSHFWDWQISISQQAPKQHQNHIQHSSVNQYLVASLQINEISHIVVMWQHITWNMKTNYWFENSHYNYTYAALYIGMWAMQTAVKDFTDLHVPPGYHAQHLVLNTPAQECAWLPTNYAQPSSHVSTQICRAGWKLGQ